MWTKQKLWYLETKRFIGSIIIALSGLLLYLDKVLLLINFEGNQAFGFPDYTTFVWTFAQSIAPIIIILGGLFKPYIISYLIPIYCYSVQIAWILNPNIRLDNSYLHAYALGTCVGISILVLLVKKISLWRKQQEMLKDEFQQETKEILNILKSKTLSES